MLGKEAGILGRREGAGLGTKAAADQEWSPALEAECGEAEAEQGREG